MSTQQARRSATTAVAALSPRSTLAARRHASGMTLVEVIVTLVVLSILTAFAVNGYTSFVRRARAAEALEQLDRFRTRMEKAFQDNGNYGVGGCAVAVPTGVVADRLACCVLTDRLPRTEWSSLARGLPEASCRSRAQSGPVSRAKHLDETLP